MIGKSPESAELMRRSVRRAVLRNLAFGVCLLALTSCGNKPEPPVDTNEAANQLRSVLEAWKGGQPYESLQQRSPPVYFNEALWRDGGNTLLDYEIGDFQLFGRQARSTVRLLIRESNGKEIERKIGYQIDTTPKIVIVRESLGP
jgi:hypothetical protein